MLRGGKNESVKTYTCRCPLPVDNSTGGANQGRSITDTNGAQNNANKVGKADIAKTGFKTYSLVGAAAVAVTAAIFIPVCIKKRKRED